MGQQGRMTTLALILVAGLVTTKESILGDRMEESISGDRTKESIPGDRRKESILIDQR